MKHLICIFLILFCISNINCGGKAPAFSSFQMPMPHSLNTMDSNTTKHENIDREFQIKDFDKETVNDKAGYVLIGLLGVALTATAIALPLVLLNK